MNVFAKTLALLPKDLKPRDVVKLKKVKIQNFQGINQGISSKGFEVFVFSSGDDHWRKIPGTDTRSPISFFETIRVTKLLRYGNDATHKEEYKLGTAFSKKLLRSNELSPNLYFDYVGEVVKIIVQDTTSISDTMECFSIIFTDYTSNPMFRLIDVPELSIYSSNICLFVTFWDNHVCDAAKLQVGQIVLLRNLHSRLIQPMENLVAVLHGTTKEMTSHPSIQILSTDDPVALDLSRYLSFSLLE